MKPFHCHTPYFKIGPFRVQITFLHVNGPFWTGAESGLKNPFSWWPIIYRHEQRFCGFTTISRGVVFGMFSLAIDICDVRTRVTS